MGPVFGLAEEDELAEERGSFQRMLAAWFETDFDTLDSDPALSRSEDGEEILEQRLGRI